MKSFLYIIGFVLFLSGLLWYVVAAFQHWDTPEGLVSLHQRLQWYGPAILMWLIGGFIIRTNDN